MRTQRIAVVTGGNRGLGLGTCRALARAGDRVVLTARSVEDAVEAAEALHGEGLPAVHPAQLDVTREDSVQAFFGFLKAELDDRIDVLVNNAGAIFEASGADTLDVPTDTLQQAFDTNTLGAHRMLLGALPRMNRQGYGRVVNVSSGMGGLAEMGERWPAYRVSKAALNALTRVFHHAAKDDVKVNSVCPGWVRTALGGPNANRSVEEGVHGIVWAATLPPDGPSGGFFRDGEPIAW